MQVASVVGMLKSVAIALIVSIFVQLFA